MTDPRNVAHDKRVQQEKKHDAHGGAAGDVPVPHRPGRKPHMDPQPPGPAPDADEAADTTEKGSEH
ncbi:MAG: hypothetical protein ABI831_26315 [Betaproteobacteria bacterium]